MATAKYIVADISVFNTISSYTLLSKSINGVIVRIGYRGASNGNLVMDTKFTKHAKGLTAAGIPWGVYFFTTAINAAEGKEEANWVLDKIKNYNIYFPIFVDTEKGLDNGRSVNITNTARTNAVVAFCNTIKAAGYETGIYASDSWYTGNLVYSRVSGFNKWVASYSKAPTRVTSYIGWQYTSDGHISGSSGDIDLSKWYVNITANNGSSSTTNESSTSTTTNSDTSKSKNPYKMLVRTIKKGSSGDDVKWLEYELRTHGYGCDLNGIFNDYDYKAVCDYQYKHGLTVDGEVGPKTIASLVANMIDVSNSSIITTDTAKNPYKVPTRTLRKGYMGDDVKWLQFELRYHKYGSTITGKFTDYDYKAVSDYQYKRGLTVDGVVGPLTRTKLISRA